ncbi:MAG: hypothetical protein EOM69_12585 [Clostridia bacterium]|nr:hypothetical protein [Clostridia bacterium]
MFEGNNLSCVYGDSEKITSKRRVIFIEIVGQGVDAEKVELQRLLTAQGYDKSAHNPAALFDEDALPVGAALLANCADRWLKESK